MGRVRAVDRLKRYASVIAGGLVLLAVAGFIVLTNTAALVITLAVVGMVIFELCRLGFSSGRDGPGRNTTR